MILDTLKTWIVAKDGNDGNAGHPTAYPIVTAGNAKLTIGAAITAAAAGDTILIFPGTYNEVVSVNKVGLTIEGLNKESVYITASTARTFSVIANGCIIRRIKCYNTWIGDTAYGFSMTADRCTIEDVYAEASDSAPGFDLCGSNYCNVNRCIGKGPKAGFNAGLGVGHIIKDCIGIATGLAGQSSVCGINSAASSIVFHNCMGLASSSQVNQTVEGMYLTGSRVTLVNGIFKASCTVKTNSNVYGVHVTGTGVSALLDKCHISVDAAAYKQAGIYVDDGRCLAKDCLVIATAVNEYENLTVKSQVTGSENLKFVDNATPTPGFFPTSFIISYKITWTTGNNAGVVSYVAAWNTTSNEFTLQAALANNIEVGDGYTLTSKDSACYEAAATGVLQVANCHPSDDITGDVIVENPTLVDVLADNGLATKVLTNKAIQNKSTGAIDYYDDDGETVILTQTPTDGESSITRTPS